MRKPTNFKDLTSKRFGMLVVLCQAQSIKERTRWVCRCDCGEEKVIYATHLVRGNTKSCGCNRGKSAGGKITKHGLSKTPEYSSWVHMMRRCYNPRDDRYQDYGGRGITVCERWHDPLQFYKDMGPRKKHQSIDRIDVNCDYSPDNCRWASPKEQQNNRRCSRLISHAGESKTLSQWAQCLGVDVSTIATRLRRGWPVCEALYGRGPSECCEGVV